MAARSAMRLSALARAAAAAGARPSLAAAAPALTQAAHSSTSAAAASSSSQLPLHAASVPPTAVPDTLPSPFDGSQTHAPTHGHHVASLHLRCYGAGDVTLQNLDFFADFALRAAYALGMPVSRPASLPRRVSLWTVPKGPFVHKKAQENFTRTTHARVIKVYDAHPHVVERWLHFCRIHAMPGLGQRAEVYRHYPLSLASQMEESARAQLRPRVAPRDGDDGGAVAEGEGPSGAGGQTDAILALARGLRVELDAEDAAGARALERERASVEQQGEAATEAQAAAPAEESANNQATAPAQEDGSGQAAARSEQRESKQAAAPAQESGSEQAAAPAEQADSKQAAAPAEEKQAAAEVQQNESEKAAAPAQDDSSAAKQ